MANPSFLESGMIKIPDPYYITNEELDKKYEFSIVQTRELGMYKILAVASDLIQATGELGARLRIRASPTGEYWSNHRVIEHIIFVKNPETEKEEQDTLGEGVLEVIIADFLFIQQKTQRLKDMGTHLLLEVEEL